MNASGLRRKITPIMTRRGTCLWLSAGWHCSTVLPPVMPNTLQLNGSQANNSNAAAEGALGKSRVIQTTGICTDFWEDFYFDKKNSTAKAYHYFFNLAMIYNGFLPIAIWTQSYTWFCSQTIQKAGFVFWQFWRKISFFLKCTLLKRATDWMS